jgi:peptide/nickel transport system ATP-binding protein
VRPQVNPLLEITDLCVDIRNRRASAQILDRVSLSVGAGECVGIVGESGSGKTVTALAVMRLLPAGGRITSGRIVLGDRDITSLSESQMRQVRGNEIGMIFQDPMTSLNPTMTVGDQIAETVRHHQGGSRRAAWDRAVSVLGRVGMPSPARQARCFPHQLSGGMRQRVMIAIALSCEPGLLIADEPTTALDVTIQKQILELIDDLRAQFRMAVLLVTHDLGVIAGRTDRVAVMYAGQLVETASTVGLFASPRHPYTQALFEALPKNAAAGSGRLYNIPGMPPDLASPPPGCRFSPRCRHAKDTCGQAAPLLDGGSREHVFRCFFPLAERRNRTATGPAPSQPAGGDKEEDGLARQPLLRVEGLVKDFPLVHGAILRRPAATVSAVADISFSIMTGQTFGLVGESGCGKTTVGRLIAGLEVPGRGAIILDGEDLTRMSARDRRRHAQKVQLMFQDTAAAMDPRMRIGPTLREPLAIHRLGSPADQRHRILESLDEVGLPAAAAQRYPHEFSGGQRQRAGLARALILRPRLIVADEPVSALDVSVQAQVLNLMQRLQAEHGLTYLLISHDLAVVRYMSNVIGVMYLGKLVELGPAEEVYQSPAHPYTQGLVDAIPVADPAAEKSKEHQGVPGELPFAANPPSGCRFRTRCSLAQDICAEEEPMLRPFSTSGHTAACHFPVWQPGADTAAAGRARSPGQHYG